MLDLLVSLATLVSFILLGLMWWAFFKYVLNSAVPIEVRWGNPWKDAVIAACEQRGIECDHEHARESLHKLLDVRGCATNCSRRPK